VLPALLPLLAPRSPVVALVKPQFEVGPARVGKGGIGRDPQARADAVAEVSAAAGALGYEVGGHTESPITGAKGNVEFLLLLRTP
jgi:23S rRNA (cytidine1920-2'-O)/16S rRNA (cytidine1409-2'-O)-methyltransferase